MRTLNVSPEMTPENFSALVNQLNTFMGQIGLENMAAQIIDNISIPAGASVDIAHNLKTTPRYRIILRQIDGGQIVDGDSQWTDSLISLKNSGGTDTIITVLILRS